jgi:hypothetical protein
MHKTA